MPCWLYKLMAYKVGHAAFPLQSHPLFPSIFALLFNLWLLGTFQPVGQQEGFQAVHVAALTSGVTRLFWSDVQTNGFEFQHLFAFLARQVGHPTHLDAVPPTLHAELVAVVMRFMLYYNQAADLATFLRQLPLRSIVSTREMAEAAGVPWLMPSGAGAEQGSSMAGAAPSTPSSSPLPPVTDSSVMRAGRFDARWGGGEATLTQAPSLSSLVGEVDAALTPGVTAAGRIPSGGLDDMELPDGWAERGGGSPGGRTATPLILDSDDEDGGTGGGGPTPTTPTLLAARPTPALDFEDALPPLPASASSMSDSGEEGCGGGSVPRTPAAPRTAAALTVASAARQELQGSPGSVEEGVGGEGVGSELLATLPTPDMPSTGGVFGEPARTFSPVSPAALRLKAAALVKCVLTMVRGIRHEASLVHCITAMRVFAEPSFQALLCPEAQARLRSGLQAFTSPGGPLFPTRAVRSMARRVLDAVFPQGVTTRRLVSLAFRMLSPYYAVESAQAFVWEGCVAAASGCGCSRRSVAQAARQAAEATGVPLPTPVSKDVQMQRRSEPLPATVLEALAMSVNVMACLCCCRSRGSAVARGGK